MRTQRNDELTPPRPSVLLLPFPPDLMLPCVRLQVLSLAQNRLKALPAYMADFTELKVFKVDQNPLEWPVSPPGRQH